MAMFLSIFLNENNNESEFRDCFRYGLNKVGQVWFGVVELLRGRRGRFSVRSRRSVWAAWCMLLDNVSVRVVDGRVQVRRKPREGEEVLELPHGWLIEGGLAVVRWGELSHMIGWAAGCCSCHSSSTSYSTLVFVFVSFITNIKVTNMKEIQQGNLLG